MWLTQYPQPRPPRETWDDDPIFSRHAAGFSAHHVESPEFMGIHYMDATTVEECWRLLRQTGKSNSYESLANIPRYTEWLAGQDWTDAYARHKQNLQLVGLNDPEKRWVLKNPSHMTALDALMTRLPRRAGRLHPPRPGRLHRVLVLALGGDDGRALHDLRRRRRRPHPARPVVAGLPRLPRRPPGVRPGAVRRHRLQGPARPTRSARCAAIYEQFGLDLTPEASAAVEEIDRETRSGGKAPRTRTPSTTTASPRPSARKAFDR